MKTISMGKHQSLGKSYKNLVQNISKVPNIKKIILGKASNAKHSHPPGRLSFKNYTDAGIKYRLYTNNGIRDLFIIINKNNRKVSKVVSSAISKYSN